jgi:hypothetical protein
MALYLGGKISVDTNDLSPKEATEMSRDIKYIGMDVHKEAIVIAVLNGSGKLVMETILESQDLVLGLHLLLQELNPLLFLFHLVERTFRRLEGRHSVLEELFLPAVEHRRLQAQLFTQIGNRDVL